MFETVAHYAGRLKPEDRYGFIRAMDAFDGQPFLLRVSPIVRGRTIRANRYYWGVVLKTLAEHTGHTVDELHDYFKARFNSERILLTDTRTGEILDERTAGRTTTTLSTKQFAEYLEQIIQTAAELGCTIPPADEVPS